MSFPVSRSKSRNLQHKYLKPLITMKQLKCKEYLGRVLYPNFFGHTGTYIYLFCILEWGDVQKMFWNLKYLGWLKIHFLAWIKVFLQILLLKIWSKVTIKTPKQRHRRCPSVFIFNFEHIHTFS